MEHILGGVIGAIMGLMTERLYMRIKIDLFTLKLIQQYKETGNQNNAGF